MPLFQNESKCETSHMKMSSACSFIFMQIKVIFIKAPANEDTLLWLLCCRHKCFPVCPRAQHLLQTQILCPGHKKCFSFCSETFCVRNKCFPVCAAQETSWATMCPQQCVLVCQGLKNGIAVRLTLKQRHKGTRKWPIEIVLNDELN